MSDLWDAVQQHPIVRIGTITVVLGTGIGTGTGVYLFLQDVKDRIAALAESDEDWLERDERWNGDLLGGLGAVREELATQTLRQEELVDIVNRQWEQLQEEHRDLMQMIATEAAADAYRQGLEDGQEGTR